MGTKVDIGIDPDADKHGIAVYIDGKLSELKMLNTIQLYRYIRDFHAKSNVTLHLEDVCARNAAWHAKKVVKKINLSAGLSAAQDLGRCKQAQISVEQMADEMGIPVKKYRISDRFKKGFEKESFKRVTGWTGRSNEDSRSAAWFGYQGVMKG